MCRYFQCVFNHIWSQTPIWVVWAKPCKNIRWIDSLYSVHLQSMYTFYFRVCVCAHFCSIFRQNVKLTRQTKNNTAKLYWVSLDVRLLRWELKSTKLHSMWMWAWKIIILYTEPNFIEGVFYHCRVRALLHSIFFSHFLFSLCFCYLHINWLQKIQV